MRRVDSEGPRREAGPFSAGLLGKGRPATDVARHAFTAAGLVCLLVSVGIYESQVTIMYFDKSIDVTAFVLATFASALLAPLVIRLLGPWLALLVTTSLLGACTGLAVLVRRADVELVASTIACVAGMWWLAVVVSLTCRTSPPLRLAAGGPFALAVLLMGRAVLRTEPLDEIPLLLAILLTVVLLAVLAAGVGDVLRDGVEWTGADARASLGLFALPFVLMLAADVMLNGAFIGGAAGLAVVVDVRSTYVGVVASGAGLATALLVARTRYASGPLAALALVVGAVLLWSRVGLVPLAGGAALAFGALLASAILVPMGRPGGRAPVIGPLALGAGWLAAAIGSLTYYIGVGLVAALAAMLAIVALACALSAARPDMGPRRAAGALAALVITLPALAIASAPGPRYVGAAGQLRVMTYNVHLGYDDGDIPAIDVIGDEIAREAPDVVGLEEVSRGTVISGGHDMLQLLAERTHMSFAFAPMLGDVEGVGVLSRFPIDEVRVVPLARSTRAKDLTRVLLLVRTGGLWFGATHLGGDDFTTQTRSIADAVHGLDRFVVSGDMNSTPETSQMRVLADAGLTDLGAAANAPTFPVADPVDRIDYLWVAGVTGTNVATPRTSASDHLPVIATVAVR